MFIYGDNVVLRAVEENDNAMLLSLINDPDTEMMLGGSSWPVSEAEQLKWFEMQERNRDVLRCVVALKDDGKAIGTLILSDIDQKNGTAQIHIKMSKGRVDTDEKEYNAYLKKLEIVKNMRKEIQ